MTRRAHRERYPAGHPLGGQFKPRGKVVFAAQGKATEVSKKDSASLPPSKFPIRTLEDLEANKKGGMKANLARFASENRIRQSLSQSLGVDSNGYYSDANLMYYIATEASPEHVKIIKAIAKHVTLMEETQRETRPEVANKLKKYSYAFHDFGAFPYEALVDHEAKTVFLNRDMFIGKDSEKATTGHALSALTHEYAHMVDHALTPDLGKAGLTGMFEPLHNHIARYAKDQSTPKWLLDSGLAYPLNGYFGSVNRKEVIFSELGKEYVSTVSEMYWMKPDYLDKLDEKFKKDGYTGPSMREMMQRTWGNVDIKKPMFNTSVFPDKINEEKIPLKSLLGKEKATYSNKWEPGFSDKNWRSHVIF